MKLQPAMLFGEHMILQRQEPIPVWGRSVRDDVVTVTLGPNSAEAVAEAGVWCATLPPMEAAEEVELSIRSAATGESVTFSHVAVGEVWLAGGQSNMEFLLKYDEKAEEMYETPSDPSLRFFRYPCANFIGCLEKDAYPDDGVWRTWTDKGNRGMFSGPSAYMGRKLREALGVPVGFVGLNWGGTPAAAWTAREDLEANPALKPILDWYEESFEKLDLRKYYALSDQPVKEPSPEMRARMEKFMMGANFAEMFKNAPPPPPPQPQDYTPYMGGPRGAVRPAGLYDCMLTKVAPFPVRGAIWYQGEDDDYRGWIDQYGESMKTLIRSWRKLWKKDFPFLQVELAPFLGRGPTGAKRYYDMRHYQRQAADALPGVHDVCILDAGDPYNIHVRKKKPVGERLALLARKYVYGEADLLADSPRVRDGKREGERLTLRFDYAGDGLELRADPAGVLKITADGEEVTAAARADGNALILESPAFKDAKTVRVEFCESNYCEDPLFNSAGLPAFSFTAEL